MRNLPYISCELPDIYSIPITSSPRLAFHFAGLGSNSAYVPSVFFSFSFSVVFFSFFSQKSVKSRRYLEVHDRYSVLSYREVFSFLFITSD